MITAIIIMILFPGAWIVCYFYTEWIEKDMKKHPGKYKFFEEAWDHYY